MPDKAPPSDSRQARTEALLALAAWAVALLVTVGLSVSLVSDPVKSVAGVPRWAMIGVFGPWIVFFAVHIWLCLRRDSAIGTR